jgi:hypothetical protein
LFSAALAHESRKRRPLARKRRTLTETASQHFPAVRTRDRVSPCVSAVCCPAYGRCEPWNERMRMTQSPHEEVSPHFEIQIGPTARSIVWREDWASKVFVEHLRRDCARRRRLASSSSGIRSDRPLSGVREKAPFTSAAAEAKCDHRPTILVRFPLGAAHHPGPPHHRASGRTPVSRRAFGRECARRFHSPRSAEGRLRTRNDGAAPSQPASNAVPPSKRFAFPVYHRFNEN